MLYTFFSEACFSTFAVAQSQSSYDGQNLRFLDIRWAAVSKFWPIREEQTPITLTLTLTLTLAPPSSLLPTLLYNKGFR
jgi:hypothetical protein